MPGTLAGYSEISSMATKMDEKLRLLEKRLKSMGYIVVDDDLDQHLRTILGTFRLSRQDLVQDIKEEPQCPTLAKRFMDSQPSMDDLRKSVLVFDLMKLMGVTNDEAKWIVDDLFPMYSMIAADLEKGTSSQNLLINQPATRSEPVSRTEQEISYASAFPALPPKDNKPKFHSQVWPNIWQQRSPLRSNPSVKSSENKSHGQDSSSGKTSVSCKKNRSNGKENECVPTCTEPKKKVTKINFKNRNRKESSSSSNQSPKAVVEEDQRSAKLRSYLLQCLGVEKEFSTQTTAVPCKKNTEVERLTPRETRLKEWQVLEQSCWAPLDIANHLWWNELYGSQNTFWNQRSASEPHLAKQEPVVSSVSLNTSEEHHHDGLIPSDVRKNSHSSSSDLDSCVFDLQGTFSSPLPATDQNSANTVEHDDCCKLSHTCSAYTTSSYDKGLALFNFCGNGNIWSEDYISRAKWPWSEANIPITAKSASMTPGQAEFISQIQKQHERDLFSYLSDADYPHCLDEYCEHFQQDFCATKQNRLASNLYSAIAVEDGLYSPVAVNDDLLQPLQTDRYSSVQAQTQCQNREVQRNSLTFASPNDNQSPFATGQTHQVICPQLDFVPEFQAISSSNGASFYNQHFSRDSCIPSTSWFMDYLRKYESLHLERLWDHHFAIYPPFDHQNHSVHPDFSLGSTSYSQFQHVCKGPSSHTAHYPSFDEAQQCQYEYYSFENHGHQPRSRESVFWLNQFEAGTADNQKTVQDDLFGLRMAATECFGMTAAKARVTDNEILVQDDPLGLRTVASRVHCKSQRENMGRSDCTAQVSSVSGTASHDLPLPEDRKSFWDDNPPVTDGNLQAFCSCEGACNCSSTQPLKFYLPSRYEEMFICDSAECLTASSTSMQPRSCVTKSASDSDLYCVPSEKSAFTKVISRSYPTLGRISSPQRIFQNFYADPTPKIYKICLVEHASEQQMSKLKENTLEVIKPEDPESSPLEPDLSIFSEPDLFGKWTPKLERVPNFLLKESKETQTSECDDSCITSVPVSSVVHSPKRVYEEKQWKDLMPVTEEDIRRDRLHAMRQANQQGIFLDVAALEEYDQCADFQSQSSVSLHIPQNQAVYVKDLENAWLSESHRRLGKTRDKMRRPLHPNKPCSFYLEGCCYRSDCKFSHNISTITCHFWEEGQCFKGDLCPFLHGYSSGPNGSDGGEEFDIMKEDFPELSRKDVRLSSAPATKKRKNKKNSVHRLQLPRGT